VESLSQNNKDLKTLLHLVKGCQVTFDAVCHTIASHDVLSVT